jgi:hypothetical protein
MPEESLKLKHAVLKVGTILVLVASVTAPVSAAAGSPPARVVTAIATGCDVAHPTFVGGAI